MHGMYAHARVDALDLDIRSQWVGKGKTTERWIISTTKHEISIKLATTVGHFLRALDFENVYKYGLTNFFDLHWKTEATHPRLTPLSHLVDLTRSLFRVGHWLIHRGVSPRQPHRDSSGLQSEQQSPWYELRGWLGVTNDLPIWTHTEE